MTDADLPGFSATPSAPTPTDGTVSCGPVKWFDQTRGYGFVLVDQRTDAFLHAATLREGGFAAVSQGDRISGQLARGPDGPYFAVVSAVERPAEAAGQVVGRVKFYNLVRGYGFVVDEAGREIFVGSKLLKRLGLAPLRVNQAVRVSVSMGAAGLVAETLTFIA